MKHFMERGIVDDEMELNVAHDNVLTEKCPEWRNCTLVVNLMADS